jgi:small subunit ribosomal protein S2
MIKDTSWDNLSKREKLQITRQRAKLEKMLGSIADLSRLPAALFIVDVLKEKIAVREAQRLGIPIFAIVDTNSNPNGIDFVIPGNDDASQSIKLITKVMTDAIREGLIERKNEKGKESEEEEETIHPARGIKTSKKVVLQDIEPVEIEEEEDLDDLELEEGESDFNELGFDEDDETIEEADEEKE